VAGEFAELTVADDGPGIEAELLPNLFGRFVRADKARSRELGSTGQTRVGSGSIDKCTVISVRPGRPITDLTAAPRGNTV
jgi:two-component system sensor histidine kinase TrcS